MLSIGREVTFALCILACRLAFLNVILLPDGMHPGHMQMTYLLNFRFMDGDVYGTPIRVRSSCSQQAKQPPLWKCE